jgi:hypothetical protein
MPSLRLLGIAGHGTGSLRNLSSTSLSGLSLGRLDAAPIDPIALAEIFPMVTELQLYGSGWPEDLAFVAELPRLARLSLDHEMTKRTSSLRVPAALRRIDLGFTTAVDLTALVRLPQLQRISLRYITEPVDMTPFRRWDGDTVTIATTPDQRLAHRDELPPTVRIRRHETKDLRYD